MKVKNFYMAGRRVVIQSSDIARLWIDPIGDQAPLPEQFHRMFSICNYPDRIVDKCLDVDPPSFFRRRLSSEFSEQWLAVVNMVQ